MGYLDANEKDLQSMYKKLGVHQGLMLDIRIKQLILDWVMEGKPVSQQRADIYNLQQKADKIKEEIDKENEKILKDCEKTREENIKGLFDSIVETVKKESEE